MGQYTKDKLGMCWEKQVKPLAAHTFSFQYQETLHQLEHNFVPWQTTEYKGRGRIWCGTGCFYKEDTLSRNGKIFNSKTRFDAQAYLLLDYGDKELYPVTRRMKDEISLSVARYTPALVIGHFYHLQVKPEADKDKEFAIYKANIAASDVTLYIRKSDHLLGRLIVDRYDSLYGDVKDVYDYESYRRNKGLFYPSVVHIGKINGKLQDSVMITAEGLCPKVPELLAVPENYMLKEEPAVLPELSVQKYSDHIYFVELKHTDDRSMIVVFNDFVLVAEAPLNSDNGERIISEAKKIAPGLPVKYFVFGHHHPHYIGGIRSFIHTGATILSVAENLDYIRYLAVAPHKCQPDSLQIEPQPLKIEVIKDSLEIGDENFTMKIYHIGKRSAHTEDYLVYYFPSVKMLFQDDLVWIPAEGKPGKAGARQAGLYNAIREFGLQVDIIIQSWPVSGKGVKTIIPFKDLELSVNQ